MKRYFFILFSLLATLNLSYSQRISIPIEEQDFALYIGNDGKPKAKEMSLTRLRASSTTAKLIYLTDSGKEGFFYRDASDNTTADNIGTCIVNAKNIRYKRIYSGGINHKWFILSTDTQTGPAVSRAVAVAINNLSTVSRETVIINSGVSTINSNVITTAVPLNKQLIIKGEPGNVIDFYNPESEGAVFKNHSTWDTSTYKPNKYIHGTIILDGLNFYGGRNPVSSYLSTNYGTRPILFRNMQRVEIKNCTFESIYGSALAVGASRSVLIQNNTSTGVYARQNNSLDATGDGTATIYAYCYNVQILGNYAKLSAGQYGRCGISIDDRSANISIMGNNVEGYERGIHVEGSKNISVIGNNVSYSPICAMSAKNRGAIWIGNTFNGANPHKENALTYTAVVTFLEDTMSIFKNNIVTNWHGLTNTYLAKFWGSDMTIEGNIFEPNRSSAEIFGYGYNYRNKFVNNEFRQKTNLRVDYNYFPFVKGNIFFGGTMYGHNSQDAIVTGNYLFPDIGDNTGAGLLTYNMTRPYVADNVVVSAASYVIENGLHTNGVFENNTHLRKHSSATTTFFVTTTLDNTGAKKTDPSRYNIIRDYITPKTSYIGNTGGITDY